MKMISSRTFNTSASEVWRIVSEPGNMPAWNPKCVSCDNTGYGGVGSTFNAAFEMRGRRTEARGEVVSLKHEAEIRYRFEYEEAARIGSVDEVFIIKRKGINRCILRHEVNFRRSTLPFWVKLLIGFIGRFGRPVGPDPLAGIDDLISG